MKEYIPHTLRAGVRTPLGHEERWTVGIEDNHGSYGVTHGPFATELEALEIVGEENAKIIHFFEDGNHEVSWSWKEDRWIQYG